MAATQLTATDFGEIKQSLIDYLKSTSNWTDYKWSGSNINIILNLLSYQTQMVSYTANLLANESFLSSASLRNNVVSLAKGIGYTPKSYTAANITTDFSISLRKEDYPNGFPKYIEVRSGPLFSSSGNNTNYIFNCLDNFVSTVELSGKCVFSNVVSYEGVLLSVEFNVDYEIYNQRFFLENSKIDTNTIRVRVREDLNSEYTYFYTQANNYVDANEESRVYWVEESDEGHYEIIFGDGLFGKKPKNGAKILISYVVTSGESANGISGADNYTLNGTFFTNSGSKIRQDLTILNNPVSEGGSSLETVSSIKFRAPKHYAAQKRCVTRIDYESLVRDVYPAADAIYVFGGESLPKPEYGRVYIVIKPSSGNSLSNSTKNSIKTSLNKYRIASLDIQIEDPEVIFIEVVSSVYFDSKITNKDKNQIEFLVRETLSNYASSSTVSKFGGAIRFSRIVGAIDDSDISVTRNNTSLRMRRDLKIVVNTLATYELCFENSISTCGSGPYVYSTGFYLSENGILDKTLYYFEDDEKGKIRTFYFDSLQQKQIKNSNFGTVNYSTGEILLGFSKAITFTSTIVPNNIIQVRTYPKNQDITAVGKVYLDLDVGYSDIVVFTEEV